MSCVSLEREGAVALITIRRPEKLNALDEQVLGHLHEAVERVQADAGVRCAVLSGEGKAFVAGADIAAMRSMDVQGARAFATRGHELLLRIERGRVPFVAAVGGYALGGGCELAMACDVIVASERAKFGQPEVKLGLVPGFGGTLRLARRVGVGNALRLVLTGDVVDAQEALRMGLVQLVVPAERLLQEAKALAHRIAEQGPLAVQAARRVVQGGLDVPLERALQLEIEAFAACFTTEDAREGMEAFLQKRKPDFPGR